ncbi:MAG: hypothetical protein D6677_01905 [Calditrichaeota bacterium]|nr:MAG: hypothetical protein D6677_01905 [Calditrichota bacterium]
MRKWFLGFYLPFILAASNPTSVPLHHPVYEFLQRMEALHITARLMDGAQPYSRGRVAEKLVEVNERREQLTALDRRRLDDFLLDFRYEIDATKKNVLIPNGQNWYSTLASWQNFKNDFFRVLSQRYPEEENHLFIWEKGDSAFYMDYRQLFTYDGRSDGPQRNANEQTYLFRGSFGAFAYQWQVSLQAARGDRAFRQNDPLFKGTFIQDSESGSTTFADRTGGELAWATRPFIIGFAQQSVQWGPGVSGKLILSDYAEAFPYIFIDKTWSWGRFTMLHGKLQSYLKETLPDGTRLYPDKWLAAHRLEIAPLEHFSFGLNEMFVYGDRYADWSYLFPLNFYRAVQHKLRDRDNATIALDAEWTPGAGVRLYGAVFIDEMKFDSLGTDWFGNKHAVQAGLQWHDPPGLANSRLTIEYVALRPWVYTHKFPINRYITDGRSLGYWAGPNSEVWYVALQKDWHARLRTTVSWRRWRKGYNPTDENVGGDILLGRSQLLGAQTQPVEQSAFLGGDLRVQWQSALDVRYEIFNDLYLSASYILQRTEQQRLRIWHLGMRFDY